MGKSLIVLLAIAALATASTAQNNGDALNIPGRFLEKGKSITCEATDGCIIMTPKELEDTANAIQRKVLEDRVCGLKNSI